MCSEDVIEQDFLCSVVCDGFIEVHGSTRHDTKKSYTQMMRSPPPPPPPPPALDIIIIIINAAQIFHDKYTDKEPGLSSENLNKKS